MPKVKRKPRRQQVKQKIQKIDNLFGVITKGLVEWQNQLRSMNTKPPTEIETFDTVYKLVFYSVDYHTQSVLLSSYGGWIDGKPGPNGDPILTQWNAEEWYTSRQTLGGNTIAFSSDPNKLAPPPILGMYLCLCGFTFVICPCNLVLPRRRCDFLERENWFLQPYLYGYRRYIDPELSAVQPCGLAGKKNRDLLDLTDLRYVYQYYIVALEKERFDELSVNFDFQKNADGGIVEIITMSNTQRLNYNTFTRGVQSKIWF
jgi:hypothetical protein